MLRTLRVLALALLAAFAASPARATQVVIPQPATHLGPATSSQFNSDLSAITAVVNGGIDQSNIGPVGLYASNLKPTTTQQATFGGLYPYTFPYGLSLGTPLAQSSGGTGTTSVGAAIGVFPASAFGCYGDGVDDDRVCLQAAIYAAQPVHGVVLLDGSKIYRVSQAPIPCPGGYACGLQVQSNGVTLAGWSSLHLGSGPTIQTDNLGYDAIFTTHTNYGVEIRNLSIYPSSNSLNGAQTPGTLIHIGVGSQATYIHDVQLGGSNGAWSCVWVDSAGSTRVERTQCSLADVNRVGLPPSWGFRASGATSGGNPNSFECFQCQVAQNDPTGANTQEAYGFVQDSGFNSVTIGDSGTDHEKYAVWLTSNGINASGGNVNFTNIHTFSSGYDARGLVMQSGALMQVTDWESNACVFSGGHCSNTTTDNFYVDPAVTGGPIQVHNFYAGNSQGVGLNLLGGSFMTFSNVSLFSLGGADGVAIGSGSNAQQVSIAGLNEQGTGIGVHLLSNYSGTLALTGWNESGSGFGGKVEAGATGSYNISGEHLAVNSSAGFVDNAYATDDPARYISPGPGYQPGAIITTAYGLPSAPQSGTTYTNITGLRAMVYLYNGTVSDVNYTPFAGGSTFNIGAQTAFVVPPGAQFQPSFTGGVQWTWIAF